MKSILFVLGILFTFQVASGQSKKTIVFPPPVIEYPDFTEFCEVTCQLNRTVYTRVICYCSKDNWRLKSPENNCTDVKAELSLLDKELINPELTKLIKLVHQQKNNHLIIDAIGILEENPPGELLYDHVYRDTDLKYKFIVNNILNIRLKTQSK